jgi:hypothetical protein
MNEEKQNPITKILSNQYKYFGLMTRIIIFCLYLTPTITWHSSLPTIRVEELLIVSYFFWFAIQDKVRISWGLNQTLHCFFCVFILISILCGSFLGYDSSFGDLNQLIRVFKYVFIYTVAITAVNTHPDPDRERILLFKFIVYISAIMSIVAIQQYFNLFGLNKFYVLSISYQGATLIDYPYPRAIGLVGNPNDLGFIANVSTLIAYALLLSKTVNIKSFLFLLLLNFSCVLTSVSRGALVGTIVGIILITFGYLSNKKIKTNHSSKQIFITAIILTICIALLLANQTMQDQMLWRFFSAENLSDDASWSGRDVYWKGNLDLFQKSPLLGVGPLRRDISVDLVADNEWFLLLRCYGIIGTIFLVMVFTVPQLINRNSYNSSGILVTSKLVTLAVLICTFLFMIPAAVYYSLALMPVVLIVSSISDTSSKTFVLK